MTKFFVDTPARSSPWFTEKIEVRNSSLHGLGVFATELIKKNEILYQNRSWIEFGSGIGILALFISSLNWYISGNTTDFDDGIDDNIAIIITTITIISGTCGIFLIFSIFSFTSDTRVS